MTPTETLMAIREICESAPLPDEKLYVGDFERLVTRYDKLVDKVYRLCLGALEPRHQGPTVDELVDIVRPVHLDETTIKAQRESWAKGDMD